jgi:hypothetical protein
MTLEPRVEIGTEAAYGSCQWCIHLAGRVMGACSHDTQAEKYVAMAMELVLDPASDKRRRWLDSDGRLSRYAGNAVWYAGLERAEV